MIASMGLPGRDLLHDRPHPGRRLQRELSQVLFRRGVELGAEAPLDLRRDPIRADVTDRLDDKAGGAPRAEQISRSGPAKRQREVSEFHLPGHAVGLDHDLRGDLIGKAEQIGRVGAGRLPLRMAARHQRAHDCHRIGRRLTEDRVRPRLVVETLANAPDATLLRQPVQCDVDGLAGAEVEEQRGCEHGIRLRALHPAKNFLFE